MPILFLILSLSLIIPLPVFATTYYVATTGSDSNNGTSTGTPFLTVNKAVTVMRAGDTTYVRTGTFNENAIQFKYSGTQANPIVLRNYPGEFPKIHFINGIAQNQFDRFLIQELSSFLNPIGWITISGLEIENGHECIKMYNAHNLTISYNYMHDCGHGILGWGIDNLVTKNRITHNGQFSECATTPSECNKDHGLYVEGNRWTITRNVIYDNLAFGIVCNGSIAFTSSLYASQEYSDSKNWVITQNTIAYENHAAAIDIWGSNCDGATIANNIFYENNNSEGTGAVNGIEWTSGSGTTGVQILYNNFRATGSGGTGNIVGSGISAGTNYTSTGNMLNTTSPGFANGPATVPVSPDFSLASGSAMIDAGTNLGGTYNGSAPDMGAFETFIFSSCQVPSGAGTKIQVTYTTNVDPPLLPASGATTYTARKGGVSNPLNGSVVRVGDGIMEITVTNAYVNGNTVDISWASGNITDSALIGLTMNQPLIQTLSNQSCTNNVGGISYTFTQAAYELHADRGTEAAPILLPHGYANSGAAENFANYKVPPMGQLRIRYSLVCGGANCPDGGYFLYYSTGGAYAPVPTDFDSGNVKFCGAMSGSDMPANGATTTNQLSTAGTFAPGGIVFTANAIPIVTGLNNGYKTELEYCITFDSDATGTYSFRVYLQSGAALDTYTVTPSLVITAPAAGGIGF